MIEEARFRLHPKQRAFIDSPRRNMLFCGGVGSGKTFAGALWALRMFVQHPGKPGLIAANTHPQLTRFTLAKMFAVLDQARIGYVFNRQPPKAWRVRSHFPDYGGILSLENGAQAICSQLTNYDMLRGADLAWAWLDETRDTDPDAISVILGRFRGFGADWRYPLRVTTTPNGYDHVWARFAAPPGDTSTPWPRLEDSDYVKVSTYDNVFEPGFADRLIGNYGKQLAEQEIKGNFVNLATGRCFAFDRARHVGTPAFTSRLPLIFSMDFNVSPLCGVVLQLDRQAREVRVLDEIIIPDEGKTEVACREFCRRWSKIKLPRVPAYTPAVLVYGDIAGRHRDTRGGDSDLAIMVKTCAQSVASVRDANDYAQRFVRDGVNAINAMLDPADGSPARLTVHERCTTLMRDLEQVSWKPGGHEIDKDKNKQLTHVSDALRYPIAQELPVEAGGYAQTFSRGGFFGG